MRRHRNQLKVGDMVVTVPGTQLVSRPINFEVNSNRGVETVRVMDSEVSGLVVEVSHNDGEEPWYRILHSDAIGWVRWTCLRSAS